MRTPTAVRIVQMAYPQVYLACHTRHQRKRSTEHHLSSRDAAILAHLDPAQPITPARLASHLGIGRSTMSEALKRLVTLGFVARAPESRASVMLTDKGARAISDTSVLETARLTRVIQGLSARDRVTVCRGLERLARACRALDGSVA